MGNRAGDREVAPGWEVQPQWRQRGHRGTGCSARSEGRTVPSLVTHKTNPQMSPGEWLLLQTAPLNPPRWLAGGHQLWLARHTSLPGPLGRFAQHQGIFGAFAQGFLQAGAADKHWGQEVTLWAWSPSLQPLHQPVFPLGVASWGEFRISLPLESVLCQGGAGDAQEPCCCPPALLPRGKLTAVPLGAALGQAASHGPLVRGSRRDE